MPLSNYLSNELLDHTHGNGAYTAPTSLWVQLHYGDPGINGTANVAIASRAVASSFSNSTAGITANSAAITWQDLPDQGSNDVISHLSLFDAATAGAFLGSVGIASSRQIAEGDRLSIGIGELEVAVT